MKTKLTPYYITLVYEACLKSFWRKKALLLFLGQCDIPNGLINSWGSDETKRMLLDRLFAELPKTDAGRRALLIMAVHLMEQCTFPDLDGWEDSSHKIKEARDAVEKLKNHHVKQEEELSQEEARVKARKDFYERQGKIAQSTQTLELLTNELNVLSKRLGQQQAGYDFQDWFYRLLCFFEVAARKPYVHDGRQIDGSMTIGSTTYLIELKFTTDQTSVQDIDSFYKKITSKADNTMGVFVSISGYSQVAKSEASGPKTPLLLLDSGHIYSILQGMMTVVEVVERVRRHASQTGVAYLPINEFTV